MFFFTLSSDRVTVFLSQFIVFCLFLSNSAQGLTEKSIKGGGNRDMREQCTTLCLSVVCTQSFLSLGRAEMNSNSHTITFDLVFYIEGKTRIVGFL